MADEQFRDKPPLGRSRLSLSRRRAAHDCGRIPRRHALRRDMQPQSHISEAESSVLQRLASLTPDTFGMIGAMILSQIAVSVEKACLAGNDAAARELIRPLADEAQRACAELPPRLAEMLDGKQF